MTGRTRTIVATTTWNTGDMVDDFVDHYQRLGAAAVLLMDFGSVDGTRERAAAWGDFVEVFDLPSLAGKDSSNALLAEAKRRYPKEWWCLFCDPDEFLVTRRMQIDDAWEAAPPDAGTIVVERRNMTGPRSLATAQADLAPRGGLTLRIDGRHERTNQEMLDHERRLEPPWIFTAVPGKVLVRLGAADSIGDGDHVAITAAATVTVPPSDAYLLHYPFRDYRDFAAKLELARRDFEENECPVGFGWQYRRWLRCMEQHRLAREYLEQFVPDERVPQLIAEGVVTEDTTVRDFHAHAASLVR
jgi:Glycosyl transferase family 2